MEREQKLFFFNGKRVCPTFFSNNITFSIIFNKDLKPEKVFCFEMMTSMENLNQFGIVPVSSFDEIILGR